MNRGRTVFTQLLQFVPFGHFEHLVDVYQANKGVSSFTAWSHFICMSYAQLTRRSGLRDLVACLNAQRSRLYHIGIRAPRLPMRPSGATGACSKRSGSG